MFADKKEHLGMKLSNSLKRFPRFPSSDVQQKFPKKTREREDVEDYEARESYSNESR